MFDGESASSVFRIARVSLIIEISQRSLPGCTSNRVQTCSRLGLKCVRDDIFGYAEFKEMN